MKITKSIFANHIKKTNKLINHHINQQSKEARKIDSQQFIQFDHLIINKKTQLYQHLHE